MNEGMEKYRVVKPGMFAVYDATVIGPRTDPDRPGQVVYRRKFTDKQWELLERMNALELIPEPAEEDLLKRLPKSVVEDRQATRKKRSRKKVTEDAIL